MKKLASTLPNMLLSLGLITLLSGALLGLFYSITKEPIDEAARRQQTEAIAAVLPTYDNDPEQDMAEVSLPDATYAVYPALEEGRLVGAAVKGASMDGFGGEIVVICGFDADGKVRDYRVLSHAETPGLGSKMEMWFRDPAGARSVLGKSPAESDFRPSKDGGEIDGITAATISSRAFLSILREAYEAYVQLASSKYGVKLSKSEWKKTDADASSGASHHKREQS